MGKRIRRILELWQPCRRDEGSGRTVIAGELESSGQDFREDNRADPQEPPAPVEECRPALTGCQLARIHLGLVGGVRVKGEFRAGRSDRRSGF